MGSEVGVRELELQAAVTEPGSLARRASISNCGCSSPVFSVFLMLIKAKSYD